MLFDAVMYFLFLFVSLFVQLPVVLLMSLPVDVSFSKAVVFPLFRSQTAPRLNSR